MAQNNIFGTELESCSLSPVTGFFRNGCCETDETDFGKHTICVVMTDDFLKFSMQVGNDLSTPRPEFAFPGLKAGDRWCVCLGRWIEALRAGRAPKIVPEACHEDVLEHVPMDVLIKYAWNKTE